MASGKPQTRPSVRHPSHNHPLRSHKANVEDEIICFGCNLDLIGACYKCTKSVCDYYLHKSCFKLPREIRHKCHPNHPLILLHSPPYDHSTYTCNACGEYGSGFTYNCSICQYDVHVGCVSMPESMKHNEHVHSLALVYSSPYPKGLTVTCDVCHGTILQNMWSYFCQLCNYNSHLHLCIADKEEESCVADEVEKPLCNNNSHSHYASLIKRKSHASLVKWRSHSVTTIHNDGEQEPCVAANGVEPFRDEVEEPCVTDKEGKSCFGDEVEDPCIADKEVETCIADEVEEPCVADKEVEICIGDEVKEPCAADQVKQTCVADKEVEPCIDNEEEEPCVGDEEEEPCVADEEEEPCVGDEEEEAENEGRVRKRDIFLWVLNLASGGFESLESLS